VRGLAVALAENLRYVDRFLYNLLPKERRLLRSLVLLSERVAF